MRNHLIILIYGLFYTFKTYLGFLLKLMQFQGMAFTNTSPCVFPTGSREKSLGSNPICMAAPGMEGDSFFLDMASTTVAYGKVSSVLNFRLKIIQISRLKLLIVKEKRIFLEAGVLIKMEMRHIIQRKFLMEVVFNHWEDLRSLEDIKVYKKGNHVNTQKNSYRNWTLYDG